MVEITKALLDVRICDYSKISSNTETLREFITNTENEFNLPTKDIEAMSNEDFISYLEFLDDMWGK